MTTANTINQELSKAHKEQNKVLLLVGDETYCYEDCVIQYIGRSTITFITPMNNKIMSYTIAKRLITGIGYAVASIPMSEEDIEDNDTWNSSWL